MLIFKSVSIRVVWLLCLIGAGVFYLASELSGRLHCCAERQKLSVEFLVESLGRGYLRYTKYLHMIQQVYVGKYQLWAGV